jgi:CheY-like chemotaxis protein
MMKGLLIALQGDQQECLRAGMDGYISKPVGLETLMDTLEKWALKIRECKEVASRMRVT